VIMVVRFWLRSLPSLAAIVLFSKRHPACSLNVMVRI
jgi:hypothetical protein